MQKEQSSSAPRGALGKRAVWIVVLFAGLWVAYEGVLVGVRWWVDDRIERNVGQVLPDFTLTDTEGREHASSALRGRVVVLNFFRSRCGGCRLEKDAVKALAAAVDPERAVVLGVMMDPVVGFPADETVKTLAEFSFDHPVLMADDAFVAAFHGVRWSHVTPVTYVADGDGRIVASLRGHQDLDALRAALPPGSLRAGGG